MQKKTKYLIGEDKGESEEDLEDLDEEQIERIFKDHLGIIKKDKDEKKDEINFKGIYCESSIYLFS